MTDRDALARRLWGLGTAPFNPRVGPDGAALRARLTASLDPQRDPRLVVYYHDVYDWNRSPLLGTVSPECGLKRFPDSDTLEARRPVAVLVCGYGSTGRRSLINLLLHKIGQDLARKPLLVDVQLSTFDKAEQVKEVGRRFLLKYAVEEKQPTMEQLQAVYDLETKAIGGGLNGYFPNMFRTFREMIRLHCDRPVVLQLSGADTFDTWKSVYSSTASLADFIIVPTPAVEQAETCDDHLKTDGKASQLVKALELDHERTIRFVEQRLARGRAPDVQPIIKSKLAPFTEESLRALFEPGEGRRTDVRHPIGWLNSTLDRAYQDNLERLEKLLEANGGPEAADGLDEAATMIRAEDMRRIREQMNRGR